MTFFYKRFLPFSKLGLIIMMGLGWAEKLMMWQGVPEGIFKMTQSHFLTSWMTHFGPLFPNFFIGTFEFIAFILLIFKERWGALLSCLTFITTLSFLVNGFSFSLIKDVALLGISLDLLLKNNHFKKQKS